ncbi:MAG: EthD family reductase [Candidatus Binataceae bacterium]
MLLNFVRFDFKSADLEAEERNYLDTHVGLAKRFPGLRIYYTGKHLPVGGEQPDRYRAAILAFDSADAWNAAMHTELAPALLADTQEHITGIEPRSADAEVIVPFDSRRPAQSCFIMAAEFDLATDGGGPGAAELH